MPSATLNRPAPGALTRRDFACGVSVAALTVSVGAPSFAVTAAAPGLSAPAPRVVDNVTGMYPAYAEPIGYSRPAPSACATAQRADCADWIAIG